jgi:aminoglycoside 3-N-acetyltransferase
MVSFRDFVNAFRQAGLNPQQPVIVHSSLSAPGIIRGGAETVVGALLAMTAGVMVPAFTYKTMIIPEVGPEDNAMSYGSGKDHNRMAEFFHPDMPCDPLMGILPEMVRCHPLARRSSHPILSFAGIHVDEALEAQTLEDPLAPVGVLAAQNGMVVLIGVNHQVNTAIHYAERLAGRKQFLRWALTAEGIVACPNFSGCSDGFQQAAADLESITCTATVGSATIHAVQLAPMIDILTARIQQDPLALLCGKEDERCMTVRRTVAAANVMTSLDVERPQGEPE